MIAVVHLNRKATRKLGQNSWSVSLMQVRRKANEIFEVASVAVGLSSMPDYNDFVKEIIQLRLRGVRFDHSLYAEALGEYIKATIHITTVSALADAGPWATRYIGKHVYEEGFMGEAVYFSSFKGSERPYFLVVVADDLPWNLRRHTIFHELAHIAAGHRFAEAGRSATSDHTRARQPAVRRLAARRPFSHHAVVEVEAEVRARYSILLADAGPIAFEKDSLNQLY